MGRAEILESIEQRLKTITTANGYATNIGLDCRYWDDLNIEYGKDGVVFRDTEETINDRNAKADQFLTVELEAIKFTTPATKLQDGCAVLEDLKNCVRFDPTWSGAALSTRPLSNTKDIETSGKIAISVTLTCEVYYQQSRLKSV